MVGSDALNAYQQRFTSEHCWATMLGAPVSLCEGDVYLLVSDDAQGFFVGPQLIAARLTDADAAMVFGFLRGPKGDPNDGKPQQTLGRVNNRPRK